ncbi:MAG: exodeoxyribonuclease VII large subunit [Proteobacteria bacterium]|nr:exodeoxyribonuclease VII large subunit [Pseudomonadota bacterium]
MASGPLFDVVEDTAPARPKTAVLTVSELAAAVKGQLEGNFARVVVQGELSAVKIPASGHLYCDLKDENAVLNGVAWRSTVARWVEVPPPGTLVVATGKLTSYPQRSTYQLMIERMEPAGLGALMQQLEALKKKLAAEGLFDAGRKKPLPFLPRRIGIITSATGAVISDMLHRLEDRCPRNVSLWPVAVQGATAAAEVAAAVQGFNRMRGEQRPDVLIVARGGGSLEDLMAFNAEVLVRAVAESDIPVISGVGHEPDVTLCDLAADVRAPTPSAAAELVVPVRDDVLFGLAHTQRRLAQMMEELLDGHQERLSMLARLLPEPRRLLLQAHERLGGLAERVGYLGPQRLRQAREKLDGVERVLRAHNPMMPLDKGFVYLTRGAETVRSATAKAGAVTVHFKDGEREAELR